MSWESASNSCARNGSFATGVERHSRARRSSRSRSAETLCSSAFGLESCARMTMMLSAISRMVSPVWMVRRTTDGAARGACAGATARGGGGTGCAASPAPMTGAPTAAVMRRKAAMIRARISSAPAGVSREASR